MSTTILNDTERRDTHVVAGLITLIKVHGIDWCKHAIDDLSGYVATNDIHPCGPGQRWSEALQKCVDDPK